MAAYGWGEDAPLDEWIFAEGHGFDFFQAVALLECLYGGAAAMDTPQDSAKEAVRFGSTVKPAFPGTDIESIERPANGDGPAKMTVNFLGLAGALGPLPPPISELVYRNTIRRDTAARDLLDIFNHRLVSLAYRIRKHHRIGLGVPSPEQDSSARYLHAVAGLGDEGQQQRVGTAARALLYYAGVLADERRSMAGLEAVLRCHFSVPIRGISLAGRFYRIEPEDRTAIGKGGKNRMLGKNSILGDRFWDQEASFDIRLGPLTLDAFRRFLPEGDALGPLCALVRFYAGERFNFGVVLVLRAEDVPPVKLGKKYTPLLGYTTFLGNWRKNEGDPQVRLRPRALRARASGRAAQATR